MSRNLNINWYLGLMWRDKCTGVKLSVQLYKCTTQCGYNLVWKFTYVELNVQEYSYAMQFVNVFSVCMCNQAIRKRINTGTLF